MILIIPWRRSVEQCELNNSAKCLRRISIAAMCFLEIAMDTTPSHRHAQPIVEAIESEQKDTMNISHIPC
jgi:hypothetical protein